MRLLKIQRVFLALLLVVLLSPCEGSPPSPYGKTWWTQTPKDQRTEFLAGYIDCSQYDAGESWWSSVSWNVLENQINQYYSSKSRAKLSFDEVLRRLAKDQHTPIKTGEKYEEKHGIFDGQYWLEASPSGRLGFVQGYQHCQITKLPQGSHYHLSAKERSLAIDQWYGVSVSDPSKIKQDRLHTKIANVLANIKK